MEKKIIYNLQNVLNIKKKIEYSLIRKCQLCNHKKLVPFSNTTLLKSDNIFIEFPFVQCFKCGLIQQKIKFSPKFHKYYYSKLYPKLLNRDKKRNNQLIENSYERGKFLFKKLKKYFPNRKNLRLLDIGCGGGGKLRIFKENGWDVYGVDPDSDLLNLVKRKYKLKNTFSKNFEDLKLKKNYFDFIIVSGSLEHVNNLNKVMEKINLYSKKSSLLFLDSKGFPNNIKEKFFNFNHHRLLGPTTINLLAHKFGYKKIICNFTFMKVKKTFQHINEKKTNLYYLGVKKKIEKSKI
ncbi:MAG: hypothetical protein CBD97_02350 [Pelagibacteraceae bacterium TMED237]|nr:MAG: hypothetical protein CBD97_02350 [Pelagibacteraceae bacterium TMED237]